MIDADLGSEKLKRGNSSAKAAILEEKKTSPRDTKEKKIDTARRKKKMWDV